MADDSGLPPEVVTLLHRSIPSMQHLEVLLVLARTTPQAWSASALADQVRQSVGMVAPVLVDLEKARLAEPAPGGAAGEYRFAGAGDEWTMRTVAALQDMYDTKPVTLVKVLYQRPPGAITAFADAFRLRPPGS